jgi:hypothetical protein
LPLTAIICVAFIAGLGFEGFGVMWDVTMQQEIPGEKLSRIYSYDALGSWALMPIGYVVAGPIAAAVGVPATFIGAFAIVVVSTLLVLLSHDVRTLQRRL